MRAFLVLCKTKARKQEEENFTRVHSYQKKKSKRGIPLFRPLIIFLNMIIKKLMYEVIFYHSKKIILWSDYKLLNKILLDGVWRPRTISLKHNSYFCKIHSPGFFMVHPVLDNRIARVAWYRWDSNQFWYFFGVLFSLSWLFCVLDHKKVIFSHGSRLNLYRFFCWLIVM